ncbi:hypothetical protein [Telluribacter sp. SYSU D00476]|uniref:hypothetical protein n=1 Tax=Telluribacter sp. SYSU D00476 TaxID=2811430 RepID=UPI001FF48CCE|nr:hypothetical protein [Telluribacter sp. SYSU D00476]
MKKSLALLIGCTIVICLTYIQSTYANQTLLTDTLSNEEIDLRGLFLTIQFEYDKESEVRSDSLMQDQINFLKSVGLPTSGIEDIQGRYDQNLTSLDKEYAANLKKIKGESYRKIYRQVASQVLIKHICLSPAMYSSKQERDRKLVYYLSEMKEAGGLNIELICASFTLLQESKEKGKVCESLHSFIPYCQWIVSNQEGDIKHLQQNLEKDPNPVEQFIFDDISKRILKNKKYIHYLTNLQNNTCK